MPPDNQPLEGKLLAKVKAEYLASRKSARVLATEFHVSEDALSRLITKDGWRKLRDKTAEKTAEKLVENLSKQQADVGASWVAEIIRMALEMRQKLFARMMDPKSQIVVMPGGAGVEKVPIPFFNAPKDYQGFIKAIADLDKVGRLGLRLDAKEKDGDDGKSDPGGAAGDSDAVARRILAELEQGNAGERGGPV